jgi:hypothetical protein
MTPEEKTWIDSASYRELLARWRFSVSGDHMFTGETGDYFAVKFQEKKVEVGPEAAAQASKDLGWEKP